MIAAFLYKYIYLIIVTIITLVVASKYGGYKINRLTSASSEFIGASVLLCVFMILFIGTRPISGQYFLDMAGTANMWSYYDMGTYSFSWEFENKLYDNLRAFMSTAGFAVEYFFILIAAIYFGSMLLACRKMFPRDTMFAFIVCLAAFSTFSYGTNGIKAGSAASLFLVALAYHENRPLTIAFTLLSWGFHHSMILVVASYLVVYFFRNPKWFLLFWVFCLLSAALHITVFQTFFASIAEDAEGYLDSEGRKGFRIDFLLYSAMPVLVGYYAIYKKKIESKRYNIVLCLYLMTNAVWMLCMYAAFNNRIAYLSWFLYPIVLIYPFLNERWGLRQYITVKNVAYAHLAFTLIMSLIVYA